MKKQKLLAIVLAAFMALSVVACTPEVPDDDDGKKDDHSLTVAQYEPTLEYAADTTLRMATGYNSTKTGITFDSETAGDGVTLADGITYHTGDLKPTWVTTQNVLNVKFQSEYQGNSAQNEYKYWKDQLEKVDMVSGTATQLNEAGAEGKVINIADYLDQMPNFKAYLEENPIVRLSITGNLNGAIYFSPYFDGVDDIERMPLMRTDWIEELLDGEGDYVNASTNNNNALAASVYTPYMPTTDTVEVESLTADGTQTQTITKDYSKYGNIIEKMNEALAAGTVTGTQAVQMLRDYIDDTYNGYYGTTRSNLFQGYDACWDADELVALLRCVVAVKKDVNGNAVSGLFAREATNQRWSDLFRFAGTLFGVRGLESRQDYLYVGTDGELHDARQEEDTYEAIARMNAMKKEGLIYLQDSENKDDKTSVYLQNDSAFMSYDYNQTQTIYNQDGTLSDGEKYMAVMVPVAKWNDGTEKYMRFTESWRSVKTDGWAISAAGVEGNQDKLYAALTLIDFAYSQQGQILMSYGPDAFIATNEDGSYQTFNFNGTWMPKIADTTYEELWSKAGGNYTNYARYYLGSTLSFVKSQAFEYQCTTDVGKEGAAKISAAIALGTIKHPELALASNSWYTSVPTVLPTTEDENTLLNGYTELSTGKFNQSKQKYNVLIDLMRSGYNLSQTPEFTDVTAVLTTVKETWNGTSYLSIKNDAWDRLQLYYNNVIAK